MTAKARARKRAQAERRRAEAAVTAAASAEVGPLLHDPNVPTATIARVDDEGRITLHLAEDR